MPRHHPVGVPYPDWIRAQIQDSPVNQSTRSIARKMNLSQSTVSRILRSDLSARDNSGVRLRECILTEDDATFLCTLKCEYPQASLAECQIALDLERGKVVSLSTVSRELKRLGMTRKKLQRFSCRRDESARVRWWTMPPHMGGCSGVDWTNLVDIDESSIQFGESHRRYGHSFAGMPARFPSLVSTFYNKPLRITFNAATKRWMLPQPHFSCVTSIRSCWIPHLSRSDEQPRVLLFPALACPTGSF